MGGPSQIYVAFYCWILLSTDGRTFHGWQVLLKYIHGRQRYPWRSLPYGRISWEILPSMDIRSIHGWQERTNAMHHLCKDHQ